MHGLFQLDKMVHAEEGELCKKVRCNSSRFSSRDGVENLVDPEYSLKPDEFVESSSVERLYLKLPKKPVHLCLVQLKFHGI